MPGDAHLLSPIPPARAIVVPRARRAPGGAALPLQALIEPVLDKCRAGIIQIVGQELSGKTTALSHLRAVLSADRPTEYLDEPSFAKWNVARKNSIAIVTSASAEGRLPTLATFYLAEWGKDDWIEYLAAVHRPYLASVLERLSGDDVFEYTRGLPGLVRIVLDEHALDPMLVGSGAALRRYLLRPTLDRSAQDRLARVVTVKRILTAEVIIKALVANMAPAKAVGEIPRELIPDVSLAIRDNAAAARQLAELLHGPDRSADSIAASILLKINALWRPWVGRPLKLNNAILDGARWDKIDLQDTMLNGATLRSADLTAAVLNRICATSASFAGALLNDARLDNANASNADFSLADMEHLRAEKTEFLGANFTRARMRSAYLVDADLGLANLTCTDLSRADLRGANLKGTLDGTILVRADLTGADLKHVDLRTACFEGTRMAQAQMLDCNLEGCEIPFADFERADLGHAYLTGSIMRGGNFRGAILSYTGLADIDWEGADLRDADLTGASFHLGSTRSGLVGSVIPCEGSRTGFYTDEFDEQDYKSPEEIRKANLSGADLRGAKVEGVDFYLVDLRGAKYTRDQAEHFARCGAILRSRVA